MRGRPVADGVAWPIPSISGAHAHYAYNSTAHMYRMRIANAQYLCFSTFHCYIFVNPFSSCITDDYQSQQYGPLSAVDTHGNCSSYTILMYIV